MLRAGDRNVFLGELAELMGAQRDGDPITRDAGVVTRADVLAQLKPAVQLTGNPEKGRLQYQNLCAQCHTMSSSGLSLMPEGLETGLSLQDVADLLSFLQVPK